MTFKCFGEQVFDEIRRQGLTYSIFEKEEKERLCQIQSRRELRAFYDDLGFDCISAVGSPSELVQSLAEKHTSAANSRGWKSVRERLSHGFMLGYVTTFSVVGLLISVATDPNEILTKVLLRLAGALTMFAVFCAFRFGFDHYRQRKRERWLKELSETDSHFYGTV